MFEDGDTTARFFYLLLLGLVIASYFLWDNRQKLSTTLQQAAIWGLIFTMAVIAYGFRDTLMGELQPTSASVVDAETVALRRQGDGHFYATVGVNGASVDFIVDTGATSVVLTMEDAEAVGFDPNRLRFTGRAVTANGEVSTAPVELDEVTLGPFFDRGVEAAVNGGDLRFSLLGMSYLSRFSRIEIAGDQMILHR